jgi:hypothetical protein
MSFNYGIEHTTFLGIDAWFNPLKLLRQTTTHQET